jgi:hypothetical protein
MKDMEKVYAAIGRAVFAAQIFETVFIPAYEFFKMHTKAGYLEKTGGYVQAGALKVPIKSIVKALAEQGNIAADLEDRLTAHVGDRHLLIHRWFQQYGWPADGDHLGFEPIVDLANRVEREAQNLARLFAGYIARLASPEGAHIEPGDY